MTVKNSIIQQYFAKVSNESAQNWIIAEKYSSKNFSLEKSYYENSFFFFFEKYSTEVALYCSIQIIMNYFILIFLFYIFIYHKNPEKPKVNIQRIQIQNFWEVGYYTSQGMLIKYPNCVWNVEKGLSWKRVRIVFHKTKFIPNGGIPKISSQHYSKQ